MNGNARPIGRAAQGLIPPCLFLVAVDEPSRLKLSVNNRHGVRDRFSVADGQFQGFVCSGGNNARVVLGVVVHRVDVVAALAAQVGDNRLQNHGYLTWFDGGADAGLRCPVTLSSAGLGGRGQTITRRG